MKNILLICLFLSLNFAQDDKKDSNKNLITYKISEFSKDNLTLKIKDFKYAIIEGCKDYKEGDEIYFKENKTQISHCLTTVIINPKNKEKCVLMCDI